MLRDTVEEGPVEVEAAEAGLAPTWASAASPAQARTERAARSSALRVDGSLERTARLVPPHADDRTEPGKGSPLDWRTVDWALRAIRGKRAALDAEEARWLRAAEDLQIWRPLGMVSALDYLERVLGYAPRTAQDRLRVARALGALPEMSAALANDDLSHSAVRELTRVATPATEAAWIEAARGESLRQLEELVADHKLGDLPDDPPDPEARTRVIRFELSPETFALLRQARTVLDDEHGTNLADDDFVATLCHAVLDGAPAAEPTGRAKFQIAVTVCARCHQGWQEGAGAQVAIDAAAVERAMCDAQHIGSLDGDAPERAHQDIPPAVMRFVWRRDGGRCRVPGCRSARGLEAHHIVHRADDGGHHAENVCMLCSSCHLAHHRGALAIRGTADRLEVERAGEPAAATKRAVARGERPTSSRASSDSPAHVGAASLPRPSSGVSGIESDGARSGHGGRGANERGVAGCGGDGDGASGGGAENGCGGRDVGVHSVGDPCAGNRSVACRGAVAPPGGGSKLDMATVRTEAKNALVESGWTAAIARAAVAAAAEALGPDVPLERLIFESFRRCPKA